MSCHACMEPALPWRACFHAWGWLGVCRDFASCQALPVQLMSALSTCQKEGAVLAVALVLCSRWLEDLWEWEWQCPFCLWVYTVTPRRSGLIEPNSGNFKPYLPASTGRPSLWQVIFSPLQITCPTKKSPKSFLQKTFKLDSVLQRASYGQNPSDTRSILTEKEKNHLPTAIWRIQMLQFSLVVNFYLSSMNLESFV